MSTQPNESERGAACQTRLSIVHAIPDGVTWETIHINIPGEYRFALPDRETAAMLARSNPDGKLIRVGSGLIWIEPAFADPSS